MESNARTMARSASVPNTTARSVASGFSTSVSAPITTWPSPEARMSSGGTASVSSMRNRSIVDADSPGSGT